MASAIEHIIPAERMPDLLTHWGETLGTMGPLIDAVLIELRDIEKAAKQGELSDRLPASLNGQSKMRMEEFLEAMSGLRKGQNNEIDPTMFRDAAVIMAGLMKDNIVNRIKPEKRRLREGHLERKFRNFYYGGTDVELDADAKRRIERRRSEIREDIEAQKGYGEEMQYFYDAILKAAELAGVPPIRQAGRLLGGEGESVSL